MTPATRLWMSIGWLAVAVAGCDDKTTTSISPDGFNTGCAQDSDCILVVFGETCPCTCPNAAINRADEAKYRAGAAKIACSEKVLCGPCQEMVARCQQGSCAAAKRVYPDAGRPDTRADGGANDASRDTVGRKDASSDGKNSCAEACDKLLLCAQQVSGWPTGPCTLDPENCQGIFLCVASCTIANTCTDILEYSLTKKVNSYGQCVQGC